MPSLGLQIVYVDVSFLQIYGSGHQNPPEMARERSDLAMGDDLYDGDNASMADSHGLVHGRA